MAFVNEYISAEDEKKYGLEEIDKRLHSGVPVCDWTIDRDRDIYLGIIDQGREEFRSKSMWTLYWKGNLLVLELQLLGGEGDRGEPGKSHWKLVGISIPEHLRSQQSQILADLEEALLAYKDGGVFSSNTDYSVTLDIAERAL